jgi:hemerythrin superfamily protein
LSFEKSTVRKDRIVNQQVTVARNEDVVGLLKNQHKQVKILFGEVFATKGLQRVEAFFELRRLIAIHETAEEESVHPTARKALSGGDRIVSARLKEENEGKKALAQLESLHVSIVDRVRDALRAAGPDSGCGRS